jgi:hypothetical protein
LALIPGVKNALLISVYGRSSYDLGEKELLIPGRGYKDTGRKQKAVRKW